MTFTDYVTPVPADWLNNVNTYVLLLSTKDVMNYVVTGGTTLPNNVQTVISTWTVTNDRFPGHFNPSTGIYTSPASGYYRVTFNLTLLGPVTAGTFYSGLIVRQDGFIPSSSSGWVGTNTEGDSIFCEGNLFLTLGQTLTFQAIQNAGSSVTLDNTNARSSMSIERLL